MTWFERLTGCREDSPDGVRRHLEHDGNWLRSKANGQAWLCGELEIVSLQELRQRAASSANCDESLSVREVVANVQDLHRDTNYEKALFQVASQFNLLEMTSPGVTPECGVGIYEQDYTQGPACAIAAGAGTIVRNYFAPVNGRIGQSADNQVDCLSGVGNVLNNAGGRLWKMVNGYALPSAEALTEINCHLQSLDPASLDKVRQALKVGIQWETQVTLPGASHTVSQVYCSAMPVAYTHHASKLWQPLATLILEAAYEATLCAGILNRARTGSNQLLLTLLGGGAFGNNLQWILSAIERTFDLYSQSGLDVAIVSYGSSNSGVRELVRKCK